MAGQGNYFERTTQYLVVEPRNRNNKFKLINNENVVYRIILLSFVADITLSHFKLFFRNSNATPSTIYNPLFTMSIPIQAKF